MTDYLYDLPNATSGLDSIVTQTISSIPSFVPMLLFFVFCVIALGGIARQKARTGTADYAMWVTLGFLTTFITALLLSLGTGFISLTYLVITLVLTILSGIWFFLDQRSSEI